MRSIALAGALAIALACLQDAAAAPVDIHPAGPSVPENLLRIELRFDRPQRLPFDIARVRLLDATGAPVRDAFLDLTLPSADARRVTLLMNPGRVKTGVAPNLAWGRALQAGATVRLVVDDPFLGSRSVMKDWEVTAVQSRGPQPEGWGVRVPRVHTRDALVVALRAPISSTADRLIAVSDSSGRRVAGRVTLSDGDTVWHFAPQESWQPGLHAIVTHPDLEDPAGNRACAAFEQVRASEAPCEAGSTLPFEPG
jgi:hypothetical protein